VAPDEVHRLLLERRFVVLQGPPGTGKTRLACLISDRFFEGSVTPIQFHPAVTYEDFVLGLSPDPKGDTLRFRPRPGKLLLAAEAAKQHAHVLLIDEMNRADLSKVLGEAIYLFEPNEVGGEKPRTVELAHELNGKASFSLPEDLYVLATMNTADRSIAAVDVAIRRRFAFVTVPPDRSVVAQHSTTAGLQAFDDLANVFVEFADDESLGLMPGHSYFLVKNDRELADRFRYELIPLLDDYLRQGLLGPAGGELQAVRDKIADQVPALAKV
jgi:5-methylcytosine-specific restriction protein B